MKKLAPLRVDGNASSEKSAKQGLRCKVNTSNTQCPAAAFPRSFCSQVITFWALQQILKRGAFFALRWPNPLSGAIKMRLPKFSALFVALVLGLSASLSHAAPVVIDNFDSTTTLAPSPIVGMAVFPASPGPTSTADASAGVNAMFGGVRNVTLGSFSGAAGEFVAATVAGGQMKYASSIGGDSSLNLVYNSGAGANLGGSTGLTFDIVNFDHANSADMAVTVTISDGTNSASSMQNLTGPGNQSLSWLYTGFNGGLGIGAVNLNSITQITVFFNSQVAHDFAVDNFQTLEAVVPEPASMLAWGSIIGLGWIASRRNRLMSRRGTKPAVA